MSDLKSSKDLFREALDDLAKKVKPMPQSLPPKPRPFSQPLWLTDDEIFVKGTDQRWLVRSAVWRIDAGEPQELHLDLVSNGQLTEVGEQRRRAAALMEAPSEARTCLERLYMLESILPDDREAIVEVTADGFDVRIVPKDSQR